MFLKSLKKHGPSDLKVIADKVYSAPDCEWIDKYDVERHMGTFLDQINANVDHPDRDVLTIL